MSRMEVGGSVRPVLEPARVGGLDCGEIGAGS